MRSYPLQTISVAEAQALQFKLVEAIQRHFHGDEFLSNGDVGVVYGEYPRYTQKVEEALADFFDSEDAVLVRGAGTGAIKNYLSLYVKAGDQVLVHDAPIYSTTAAILDDAGIATVTVDYNTLTEATSLPNVKLAIVQHSRQKMEDSYSLEQTVKILKLSNPNLKILVDDNYAVMKTPKTGFGYGADASCFSLFKLLGKEGIGCVLCSKQEGGRIRKKAYSGGSKVQGFEAMECLRGLVYTPVSLAIQSEQVDKIVAAVNNGIIPGAVEAVRANAQSVVALVRFAKPIAKSAVELANHLGAAPYPVGAESKYEIAPMFYRLSGTFIADHPELSADTIRINPMRSGAEGVLRILDEICKQCEVN